MEDNNVNAPEGEALDNVSTEETPEPTPEDNTEGNEPSQNVQATQEEAKEPYKEPEYDITQFVPKQTQPNIMPDEDGYIDPNAFYNKVLQDAEARIEQKLQFQEAERRAWDSVEKRYPELKEDPEIREMLLGQRVADVARGGKGDLNKLAEKLFGKLETYKAKGKTQAQVSEKVQKSAALQQTTANNIETSRDSDLMERMSRGDENAKLTLIEQWLEEGKL